MHQYHLYVTDPNKNPTRLKENDITRLQRPRAGVGEQIVKIYACLFIVS